MSWLVQDNSPDEPVPFSRDLTGLTMSYAYARLVLATYRFGEEKPLLDRKSEAVRIKLEYNQTISGPYLSNYEPFTLTVTFKTICTHIEVYYVDPYKLIDLMPCTITNQPNDEGILMTPGMEVTVLAGNFKTKFDTDSGGFVPR